MSQKRQLVFVQPGFALVTLSVVVEEKLKYPSSASTIMPNPFVVHEKGASAAFLNVGRIKNFKVSGT